MNDKTRLINEGTGGAEAYHRLLQSASRRLIPISALVELTYRCNLSCRHCYLIPRERQHPSELTLPEWEKVFQNLSEMGTLFLTFTGGEPILYPDFLEVFQIARKYRFAIRLFSNGTLIDPHLASHLATLQPLEVEISLYAAREDIHDWFSRTPGSYRSTLKGIDLLVSQGIKVNIKTTILSCNRNEIVPLKRLARERGANVFFSFLLSPRDDGNPIPLAFQLNSEEILKCLGQIHDSGHPIPNDQLPPPDPKDPICGAGRSSVAISPEGEVFPCVQIRRSAGNILSQDFSKIWSSSALIQEIRKISLSLLASCRECAFSTHCALCPGMSFTLHHNIQVPYWPSCEVAKAWKCFSQGSIPSPCPHT